MRNKTMARKKKQFLPNGLDRGQVQFLLEHYRKEWEELEYALKEHERAERGKKMALQAGEFALAALMFGGLLTVACVAPKVFTMVHESRGKRRFFREENMPEKLRRLSARAYFTYQAAGEGCYKMALTKKGEKLAQKFAVQNFKLRKEKEWDGKWRVILFDIPKKHGAARDALRHKLRQIGAEPLQKSVFIYPYSCREEIMFWASIFNVPNAVFYLEVESIFDAMGKHDEALRTNFNMPR